MLSVYFQLGDSGGRKVRTQRTTTGNNQLIVKSLLAGRKHSELKADGEQTRLIAGGKLVFAK